MRILLVSPEYKDTFWSFKHALPFIGAKAAFPPLGLLTIAGLMPKDWDIKLVDMNVCELKETDILWADHVFISSMIAQSDSLKEVIAKCVKLGATVSLGGPILETEDSCRKFPGVSYYFLGEAENTLPQFFNDLEKGTASKIYCCKDFPDITLSPMPRYDLINPNDYGSAAIQDSRGCPFLCTFCNVSVLNGRKWRCKNPDQFLKELDELYRIGFRGAVQIFSDNFVGNISKTKILLQEIIKWQKAHNYPFLFTVEAVVTIADDPELMKLMVAAGIKKVFLGLETNDPDCLRECRKLQNLNRDMVLDCHKIMEHGLIPMSGFMVGFDSEKADSFADNIIKFIQESGIVVAMVDIVQAQPGTVLYYFLKENNRLLGDVKSNTDWEPNFVPVMPIEILIKEYKRIVETINDPRRCYERILVFLKNYDITNRPIKKISLKEIRAFIRSVLQIGILGDFRTRWYFWKTLFVALYKNPAAFVDVITFQIYLYHLQKSKRC